jgi:hypothetical protein
MYNTLYFLSLRVQTRSFSSPLSACRVVQLYLASFYTGYECKMLSSNILAES